jgi:hypothetical protein
MEMMTRLQFLLAEKDPLIAKVGTVNDTWVLRY